MTLAEAADRIGARLCRDAIWSGGRCTWVTEGTGVDSKLVTRAMGPDFYDGTCGVAWFLHALGEASGDPVFRETAEGALAHALDQAERIPPEVRPGLYSGWGGISWTLRRFGRGEDAAEWAGRLPVTTNLDIMCGSAGAIPVALAAGNKELAMRHGDELLSRATGGAWRTLARSARSRRPHLTGFAHGAAGIAWSLLELSAATGEARFREAAEAGFAYERSCFSSERANWPDYRTDPPTFPVAWCHGATGIGLVHGRAAELLGHASYFGEAEAAKRTALSSLQDIRAGNFSLCHGHAGNIEFCGAREALEAGVSEYEEKRLPWPCGLKGAGELPGLMLGIAGVGYTCLRFAEAGRYPNVLLPA